MRLLQKSIFIFCLAFMGSSWAVPSYEFIDNDPTGNHRAGRIEQVSASYDANSQSLSWETTLTRNRRNLYNGFWLVLSDGPNPKRHVDEYAIFYADAINNRLTAYVYNGRNSSNSWRSEELIHSYSGVLNVSDTGNSRTMGFSGLDVSMINSFFDTPDWDGAMFGSQVGIWFHPVILRAVRYDQDGGLERFRYRRHGWYDKAFRTSHPVPEASTIALFAVSLIALAGISWRLRRSL